ncbi:MAG: NHL repeat-containing protein [Pseudomonadota bacterium]
MKRKTPFPKPHFFGCSFLLAIIIILNTPSPTIAAEEYRFERMWPPLRQPWYFNGPFGITVDNSGFVYVADYGNHRIQKFTSEGQFVAKWGTYGSEPGNLNRPVAVACGSSGRVFVSDTFNHRIQVFSQTIPLNVSSLDTDLIGPPSVNTPVTVTFSAQGTTSGNLYYQYWLARGYQTADYGHWQKLKDWSSDNFILWTPTTNDHYVMVAYVAQEMNSQIFHQAGLGIETQGNSTNPIQITELTTTMGYPQGTGTAITLNTTAFGGNG